MTPALHPEPKPQIGCDLVCRRCGYNLRGLTRDHRCPECGLPVRMSLSDALLDHANPDYVSHLATACRLTTATVFSPACALLLVMFGSAGRSPLPLLVAGAMMAAGPLLYVWSTWLLTTLDDCGAESPWLRMCARRARATCLAALALLGLTALVAWLRITQSEVLFCVAMVSVAAAAAACEWYRIRILNQLAWRTEHLDLASDGEVILLVMLGCIGLPGLAMVLAGLAGRRFPLLIVSLGCLLYLLVPICIVAVAIFAFRWLLLYWRFARVFDDSAEKSQTRWERQEPERTERT